MLVMIHTSQLFFIECNYPILFAYWIFAYAIMFLLFFANFYIQSYKKKPVSTKIKSEQIKIHVNGYKKIE
jgi:elongation of very long chain fatty acids protein 7